jgi:hypothetical protein
MLLQSLIERIQSNSFINRTHCCYLINVQGKMMSVKERNHIIQKIMLICGNVQSTSLRAISIFDAYMSVNREVFQNINGIMCASICIAKKIENEKISFYDVFDVPSKYLLRLFESKILKNLHWNVLFTHPYEFLIALKCCMEPNNYKLIFQDDQQSLNSRAFRYVVCYKTLDYSPLVHSVAIVLKMLPSEKCKHSFIRRVSKYTKITAKKHKAVEECFRLLEGEETEERKVSITPHKFRVPRLHSFANANTPDSRIQNDEGIGSSHSGGDVRVDGDKKCCDSGDKEQCTIG